MQIARGVGGPLFRFLCFAFCPSDLTPLDATLPQVLILKDFKPFRINTYEKPVGGCIGFVPVKLSAPAPSAREWFGMSEQKGVSERSAAAEVVGVLHAHFHEDFDADAEHAGGQSVAAHHFRQILAIQGGGVVGVRHGDEEPQTHFIARFAGLKIDAGARDAHRAAQILEMRLLGIRGANAHELRDFAAAIAAPLGLRGQRFGWRFGGGFLGHQFVNYMYQVVMRRHGETGFPDEYLSIQENPSSEATKKPIARTYP